MRKILFVVFLITLSFFFSRNSFAASKYKHQILGVSTQSSELDFPAVSQGPGFILPDSFLYPLDNLFQQAKLFIAQTPEDKAKIRAQIAGERLAELRLMLQENNVQGTEIALSQISKDTEAAAKEITDAANGGQNVEEAAKQLNEAIKSQRDILGELSDQADGSLKLRLSSTREAVKVSKASVDDHLPDALLEQEIEDDLQDGIEDNASDVEHSTSQLEDRLNAIQEQATEAAKKSQEKRLEILKRAIERKNETLKKQAERDLEIAKKQQEADKKQQELLREKAKKAAEAAKELNDQVNNSNSNGSTSDSSSGSTSNSNSGSGSSGSDGGSSGEGHGGDDN